MNAPDNSPAHHWASNDLLVRIARSESLPGEAESASGDGVLGAARPTQWANAKFDDRSLDAVVGDPDLFESLSAERSDAIPTKHLLNFVARNRSTWALEVLAGRFSGGLYDWSIIRAAAVRFLETPREYEPTLDRIDLEDLWRICQALHERTLDLVAEHALLGFIASRLLDGGVLADSALAPFMEALLAADMPKRAEALLSRLEGTTWQQHAISVALEHPNFGGTCEAMLVRLNQVFRRFGLERIELGETGDTAFQRMHAPSEGAGVRGPLVSVVMVTHQPDADDVAAARSIAMQTYVDWELIVVDDGSSPASAGVLDEIAALDSRIAVVRNSAELGAYRRRNEGILRAEGEFVAFQNAGEWSHPRRLELQVRDLLDSPDKIANVVRAARVTADLSLTGWRGTGLILAEPSIVFRRERVTDLVGYLDEARGAFIEFRKRLETVTGTRIECIGPELPLEFVQTTHGSDAEHDFGVGTWTSDAWWAYQGSISRFHSLIASGVRSPYLPSVQDARLLSAPPELLGGSAEGQRVDILVVVDTRESARRTEFIDALADELLTASASGLRVALLHSDAPSVARNAGPVASVLQALIDTGRVLQVLDGDEIEAGVVVVRNAGAAMGHPLDARPITTSRVVVVEDVAGGDVRGATIARRDVLRTVRAWVGLDPEWVVARPKPPRPEILSVVVSENSARVTVQATDPERIVALRIGRGADFTDIPAELDAEGSISATVGLPALPIGDLTVSVVRSVEDDQPAVQACWIVADRVTTRSGELLLVPTDTRGLRILDAKGSTGISSTEFAARHLSAKVVAANLFRGEIQLAVETADSSSITAIHAIREVNGKLRRRVFWADRLPSGEERFVCAISDLIDTRWKMYGRFRTPLGVVEAPIAFGDETRTQDSPRYRIRKLVDDGVGVLHIVAREVAVKNDEPPVLSIVMPVYNVAPFLDTAIRSVLTQKFSDFELIIIDDASTDNGRQIIEMHRALDPRIIAIELDHNTLGGAGVPSNLGIRSARGKYVAFVDSDDWVTESAFARMIELAESNDAELVIGDFRTFGENERVVSESYDSAAWRGIPLSEVISADTHPSLMRLSPVPWRKLYRRDFLQQHHVLYPEGDFFYEDNPLHWAVLSKAQRVVACDEIVSFHRMEREGQTMGAYAYKLGAVTNHANTILNTLIQYTGDHRALLFAEFIDYISRQRWTVRRQTQEVAARILQQRLVGLFDKALAAAPEAVVPQATRDHFAGYRATAYPEVDLTIVIPVFNSADLLPQTLESVLGLRGLQFNVLLIDDGSTDASLSVMREYEQTYPNVHVFEQKNRGAGRARNAVIPFCTGRFTYFLDADDVIDPDALTRAVRKADDEGADLLFVKYRIEFTDEGRSRGMFEADTKIWDRLFEAESNAERQQLVASLINYPWNRIIRTSTLQDANLFFGPTVVHNDVLFHWHSILAAQNIGFLDVEVCTHRKFAQREQVTNINDERRMAVLEALRGTHQRISDLDSYENVRAQWSAFALHLLDWAKGRIPEALQEKYLARAKSLAETIKR